MRRLSLVLAAMLCVVGTSAFAQQRWYVATNGMDGNLGTSWASPFRTISNAVTTAGAGDMVVAVEKWTDFPPEASRLPKVGTEMNVDMDRLLSLKPDLVLASLSVPGMEKNVRALEKGAMPHMVLDPPPSRLIAPMQFMRSINSPSS